MIDTGTLMLGKGLLTASALLGFCIWQLVALRRMRERDEAARRAADEATRSGTGEERTEPRVGEGA